MGKEIILIVCSLLNDPFAHAPIALFGSVTIRQNRRFLWVKR